MAWTSIDQIALFEQFLRHGRRFFGSNFLHIAFVRILNRDLFHHIPLSAYIFPPHCIEEASWTGWQAIDGRARS